MHHQQLLHLDFFSNVFVIYYHGLTHDGGEAESEAKGQSYLAGHAAPALWLSEEDDGAEEGHNQGEEQREAQQDVIGFDQRRVDVHDEDNLEKSKKASDTSAPSHLKEESFVVAAAHFSPRQQRLLTLQRQR